MKYVYVVTYGYAYEGEQVDGVYSTLTEARKNCPSRGDSQHIYKMLLNSTRAMRREMPWQRGGKVGV